MRRRLSALLALAFVVLPGSSTFFAAPTGPTLATGEINGAKFTIALPVRWNHRALLLAHGLRDPGRPLVADLSPDHAAYKTLREEGWLIAKTSYRRNGLIIADAMADLDALRAHIAATYGSLDRVLLEGESMGGLIITLLAERRVERPALYHGAVAIGAALEAREPDSTAPSLRLQPQIPLIFLTNQSELEGPRRYVAADVLDPDLPRPVLFTIARSGHVNVNQAERLVALRALNAWIERGPEAVPRPALDATFFDATVPPAPRPSLVRAHPDGQGFDCDVVEVSAIYGNVFVNAQPADFAAAGITRMARFQLVAHEQRFRVVYGRDFSSVKRAEWVAFPNADGFFWLARSYADAASTAKLKPGDTVSIRRINDPR